MTTDSTKILAARSHLEAALAIIDELGLSLIGARIDHVINDLNDVGENSEPDVIVQVIRS